MHLSPPFRTYVYVYIHPSSTIVSLLLRSKFSFFAWRGWNCLQFMTTCRASSSYGRLPRYRKRRWIFLYPRLWVPPTKITRSWIISVSAFLGNFRALMRVALYTSSDKCCLQACWGDEVYSEWGGEFFCTEWKFVATFKRGFWTIEIEKLRKSRFSKGFLGMVDSRRFEEVRDSNYRTSNYASEERFGIEWKEVN